MGPVTSSADDVVVDDVVTETEGLWSRCELFNGGGQDGVHIDLRIHPCNISVILIANRVYFTDPTSENGARSSSI